MFKNILMLKDLIFLALFASLFYFIFLGSYPLFTPDEGRYASAALSMAQTKDFITPKVNGVIFLDKPILYYWLSALSFSLFGLKEWAARLFPACFGIVGILLTYYCGRRIFNREVGLIGSIILTTTPLFFGGSHYANLDLETAVLISASLLFFLTACNVSDNNQKLFFILAYFFAALAFLTKGLIAVVFPAVIALIWMLITNKWALFKKCHLISGMLLISIISLPWYFAVSQKNPEFFHYFFIVQQFSRFTSSGTFNNQSPFWFYLPIVLIGFFPWSLFLLQSIKHTINERNTDRTIFSNELFLWIWVIVIFIFFSIPKTKIIGYILPIMPALSLLIAKNLDFQIKNHLRLNFNIKLLFSACLITLLMLSLFFSIPKTFISTFKLCMIILLFSLFSITLIKKAFSSFILFTSMNICLLLTIVLGLNTYNENTVKYLVERLKPRLTKTDEIVNYYKFYQDLPFYLQSEVKVVADWNAPDIAFRDNWRRELWLGMRFQKEYPQLINENNFWQLWGGPKRVFVFLNKNFLEQFKNEHQSYYELDHHYEILLLSNQP